MSFSLDFDYLPLLVVAGLAWIIPMALSIFRAKRVPSVIIEIILGYFAGRFLLLHASHESLHILEFLGLTGFIFLMFLSGLEIDMDQLIGSFPRRRINYPRLFRNPLITALAYFGITLILSYAGATCISFIIDVKNTWYFALIMVKRGTNLFIPHDETYLKTGDIINIMGTDSALEDTRKKLA
jgi:trk system potassium uptake protein